MCTAVPLSLSLLKWLFKINNCLNDLLWQGDEFSGKFGRGSRAGTELVDLLYHGAWGPLWCGNEFFNEKKKRYHPVLQWKTVLKHSFPSCFCPCHLSPNDLRNTQVSKTAPCDTTARHQILGRIERAWGLSSGFHSLPKTGYCYAGNLLLVLCHAALPATPQAIVSPGMQLGAWAWLQG